jgi:2-methylcitrate dehydratase PrpD
MNYTEKLSDFVVKSVIDNFPGECVEMTRKCFLDWVGVTIGGMRDPSVELLIQLIREMGGLRQATILGYGTRTNVLNAALVNGTMSHVLDFDDAFSVVRTHPSAPLIPALLSVGEHIKSTGRDLITAFVTGFEVTIRIGLALGKAYYDNGWHATSVLGRFGAAAGVGKLLNLNNEQMCIAFGLAATQAGGLRDVFGTMGKSYHVGKAAMDGVSSSLLAKRGFTAPADILSKRSGFAAVFSPEYNPEMITDKSGSEYHILNNSFKAHAACLLVHPVIDCLISLREERHLNPEKVESVHLEVAPLNMKVTGNPEPKNSVEAKFSLHFGAAIAIIRGDAGNSIFVDEIIRDPLVTNLIKRITVSVDNSLGETEARVAVVMKDGTHCFKHVVAPKGDPANPLTFSELEKKFRDLTEKKISTKQSNGIVEMITKLEELDDIAPLVKLCCVRGKAKKDMVTR